MLDATVPTKVRQYQVASAPSISWHNADPSKYYTLLMVDPGPQPYSGDFKMVFVHMLQVN